MNPHVRLLVAGWSFGWSVLFFVKKALSILLSEHFFVCTLYGMIVSQSNHFNILTPKPRKFCLWCYGCQGCQLFMQPQSQNNSFIQCLMQRKFSLFVKLIFDWFWGPRWTFWYVANYRIQLTWLAWHPDGVLVSEWGKGWPLEMIRLYLRKKAFENYENSRNSRINKN